MAPTLKKLLTAAMKPVGETLYIYGGGWNKADTGAGKDAVTIGVSPSWKRFCRAQDGSYNYREHMYEIRNGLDCSGYVGWVIYNTLETENGHEGYVYKSGDFARILADKGWGEFTPKEQVSAHCPGDIMSSAADSHIYISLGDCADGSELFLHSSPPGVFMCGTPGIAANTAERYMSEVYPEWYAKFPVCSRGKEYLENYDCFRWSRGFLPDTDGLCCLSAPEVLYNLCNFHTNLS